MWFIIAILIICIYLFLTRLKNYGKEYSTLVKALNNKSKNMAKYGGRMVVGSRGSLREEFDTDEGRRLYHKSIVDKAFNKQE